MKINISQYNQKFIQTESIKGENKMKNKFLIPLAGFLIALYTFTSCKKGTPAQEEKDVSSIEKDAQHAHIDSAEAVQQDLVITSKQFKAAGIELGNLKATSLGESIKATGTLDVPPQNYAEVSTYIGGIIKTIKAYEGDHVSKGQIVMTLEHPDFIKLQEDYTSVKNSISYLEKDYERQKELYEAKASSGKVFQEAESKYNTEKGRFNAIESQLSMLGISTSELDKGNISKVLSLRSPINGYIGKIHGSMGAFVEPNKMLFDVIDNSRILVHLDVFEKDFYKIIIGQKISIVLPNQDNAQIEGEVFKIGKAMDNITKSIAVHAEIKNNKHLELIPGIFISALIHVASNNVTAVPAEAVIRAGEKQYVFVVNDLLCSAPAVKGKDPYKVKDSKGNIIPLAYRMIEVKTGTEANEMIEVIPMSEITSTAQLVIKGAYYLMSALKSGETVGCCAPADEEKKEK
ncbi:MAG: efflux RND transporter periplasmic adaptor subunit [Bacteroidia bacterium]